MFGRISRKSRLALPVLAGLIALAAALFAVAVPSAAYADYTITYDQPVIDEKGARVEEKVFTFADNEDAVIFKSSYEDSGSAQLIVLAKGNGGLVIDEIWGAAEEHGVVNLTMTSTTTFVSWNTDKDGNGTSYKAGDKYTDHKDLKLYAQFEKSSETSWGDVPVAVREGYILEGWYDQPEGGNKLAEATGKFDKDFGSNTILYAHWTPAVYTVKFFSGTTLISEVQAAYGTAAVAPATIEVPVGKVFAGWDADITNITGDMEVHAVFSEPSGKISPTGDMTGIMLVSAVIGIVVIAGAALLVRRVRK